MGDALGRNLYHAFSEHPHVGDIRGKGLMWAIELVADRDTKRPFPSQPKLYQRVFDIAFERGLIVYSMGGCADGKAGDHIMISPPLVVNEAEIEQIVDELAGALDTALAEVTS